MLYKPTLFRNDTGRGRKLLVIALLSSLSFVAGGVHGAAAVAYSKEAYGYAYNVKTLEEAERLALEAARRNGGGDIRILASTATPGYGAIAADGNIIGVTLGYPDLPSAMQRAKQECIRQGGRVPRVIVTWNDRGY